MKKFLGIIMVLTMVSTGAMAGEIVYTGSGDNVVFGIPTGIGGDWNVDYVTVTALADSFLVTSTNGWPRFYLPVDAAAPVAAPLAYDPTGQNLSWEFTIDGSAGSNMLGMRLRDNDGGDIVELQYDWGSQTVVTWIMTPSEAWYSDSTAFATTGPVTLRYLASGTDVLMQYNDGGTWQTHLTVPMPTPTTDTSLYFQTTPTQSDDPLTTPVIYSNIIVSGTGIPDVDQGGAAEPIVVTIVNHSFETDIPVADGGAGGFQWIISAPPTGWGGGPVDYSYNGTVDLSGYWSSYGPATDGNNVAATTWWTDYASFNGGFYQTTTHTVLEDVTYTLTADLFAFDDTPDANDLGELTMYYLAPGGDDSIPADRIKMGSQTANTPYTNSGATPPTQVTVTVNSANVPAAVGNSLGVYIDGLITDGTGSSWAMWDDIQIVGVEGLPEAASPYITSNPAYAIAGEAFSLFAPGDPPHTWSKDGTPTGDAGSELELGEPVALYPTDVATYCCDTDTTLITDSGALDDTGFIATYGPTRIEIDQTTNAPMSGNFWGYLYDADGTYQSFQGDELLYEATFWATGTELPEPNIGLEGDNWYEFYVEFGGEAYWVWDFDNGVWFDAPMDPTVAAAGGPISVRIEKTTPTTMTFSHNEDGAGWVVIGSVTVGADERMWPYLYEDDGFEGWYWNPLLNDGAGDWEWIPLPDGGYDFAATYKIEGSRIHGANPTTPIVPPTLFPPVTVPGDAGTYTVTYLDGLGKALVVSEPYVLTVYPAGTTIPVTGLLGLALLAGACALSGAAVLRRKK